MIRLVRRFFGRIRQPVGTPIAKEYKPNSNQKRSEARQVAGNPLRFFQSNSGFGELLNRKLSIPEACQLLARLQEQTKSEWDITFGKVAFFVEKLFESHGQRTPSQSYQLFISLTELHKASGSRRSQNLTRIYNRLLADVLSKQIPSNRLITVMLHTSYFNPGKARQLLMKYRDETAQAKSVEEVVQLLSIMKLTKFYPSSLVDTCMDVSFENCESMSLQQVLITLECMADSNKVINSNYLLALLKKVPKEVNAISLLHIASAVSSIEKNMKLDSAYMFDLDAFYDWAFESLNQTDVGSWQPRLLIKLVNCIRRSSYCHESLIKKLVNLHINSPVKELGQVTEGSRKKSLILSNMFSLLHLSAVFDLPGKDKQYSQFTEYCVLLLRMVEASEVPVVIENKYLPRVIWSLCVLLPAEQIRRSVWFLMKLFQTELQAEKDNPNNFASGALFALDSCLTYFRPIDRELCQLIESNIKKVIAAPSSNSEQQDSMRTYTSATQKEVVKTLLQMGILCVEEHSVHNLYCDICIPDLGKYRAAFGIDDFIPVTAKNIIIELHGFQHFLRNTHTVKGGSLLKKKLLRLDNYHYYYIPIDQWQLAADDKKSYLKQFLRNVYLDISKQQAN